MRYPALFFLCLAAIGPTNSNPALAQVVIGKHTLGETTQEWFAAEGINLEGACQQSLPEAAAQLQKVFFAKPEKPKSKNTVKLCQTILQIQQTGAGKLELYPMEYRIANGRVGRIERSCTQFTMAQEMQFLIDKFGKPTETKTKTYQNGYGATFTAPDVPVQREVERVRSPLVSIPPLRGGDFQGIRVYRSDVFLGRARKANFRA
ncbi:MAG: hypothetical protein NTW28_21735, partial [Candidatus Solibacter sp.]|nr:hypothetical protein [Candidatus Solibacter sp.]